MHSLKYHHLIESNWEDEFLGEGAGEAPGKYWQDKATPGRRYATIREPHDTIPPASPVPQPHTDPQQPTPQETPEGEYQMSLSGFSSHPSATFASEAVGMKGGSATTLAGDDDDTTDTADTQPTPKHHGSQTRKVQQVSGYLNSAEFGEVERLRGSGTNQMTRGAVVTKLIRKGLNATLDNKHAELLEPRIEQTMERLFAAFVNRFMRVISETYCSAKAGDIKLTDLMSLAYGSNTEEFHKKIAEAEKEARLSLTRRTQKGKTTPENGMEEREPHTGE